MTPSVRWAFGSFFFLYFAYVGLVSPYASLFFLDRGFSVIEIAVLMSMLQITRIVGPFSWGWLSDYLSDRIGIIRFCACLAAVTFLRWAHLPSFWERLYQPGKSRLQAWSLPVWSSIFSGPHYENKVVSFFKTTFMARASQIQS